MLETRAQLSRREDGSSRAHHRLVIISLLLVLSPPLTAGWGLLLVTLIVESHCRAVGGHLPIGLEGKVCVWLAAGRLLPVHRRGASGTLAILCADDRDQVT